MLALFLTTCARGLRHHPTTLNAKRAVPSKSWGGDLNKQRAPLHTAPPSRSLTVAEDPPKFYPATSVREAAVLTSSRLTSAKMPEPREEARHLVGYAAGVRFSDVTSSSSQLGERGATLLAKLIERRISSREPVQYIVGEWDFHNLENVAVRPPALVPRPETEQLVDLVLEDLRAERDATAPFKFLDVGAGLSTAVDG